MNKQFNFISAALFVILLTSAINVRAQWITQSFALKAGWNAVYLHVDATHTTLDALIGNDLANPIQEIWLWDPAPSTLQFVTSPQDPVGTGTQWSSWARPGGSGASLSRLIGNAAYLVRVDGSVPNYTWNLKGKAVAPKYNWTTTGLNFLDFPTPHANPPSFESFLAPAPDLQLNGEFYRYIGGGLGPNNPQRVVAFRTTPVNRGEALWMRSGTSFNRYFGPFELILQGSGGVNFSDSSGQNRLRLRNVTAKSITVTLNIVPSENAPSGQPVISGTPPILVRGAQNITNLTYGYSNLLTGPQSWTLPPQGQAGSDLEIVLGLNRFQMPGEPGDLYGAVLRFSDSTQLSEMDIPVSAQIASTTGLWVGDASVTQVGQYLETYQKDASGNLLLVEGKYMAASTTTNLGNVVRPFPLRLIVHNGTNGTPVLLQRVYYGRQLDSNLVLSTQESSLDPTQLNNARRISATHLPWSTANVPWSFSGEMKQGTNMTVLVSDGYDDQVSNPFVHAYHPDHDNLNATFDQKLPQGEESYAITREIILSFSAPGDDFQSLTASSQAFLGNYDETMTLSGKPGSSRKFYVRGSFSLNRISNIPNLMQ